MPFDLSNAPDSFMGVMNEVFKRFIGLFAIVYFDDVLVYIQNERDCKDHLRQVF